MNKKLEELALLLKEIEEKTGNEFMDNILSEGCIIKNNETCISIIKQTQDYKIHNENYDGGGDDLHSIMSYEEPDDKDLDFYEIIGHLGLSSILKCIEKSSELFFYRIDYLSDGFIEIYKEFTRDGEYYENENIGKIPLKEPNLMSEKELDSLILLIKQLYDQ